MPGRLRVPRQSRLTARGCRRMPGGVKFRWRTERYADLFRVLGDPTRLEILFLLASRTGETCVCDIREHFSLRQPTVSHHLAVLRQAGLVTSRKRGLWVWYAVRGKEVERVLSGFRADLQD